MRKHRKQKLYGATAFIGSREKMEVHIEIFAESLQDAKDTLKEFFLREDVKLRQVYRLRKTHVEEERNG